MAKKTIKEVASIVDNEGLGYAIMDYMGAEDIKDEELSKLWSKAAKLLNKIDSILEPHREYM